jgi:hypothetical protein
MAGTTNLIQWNPASNNQETDAQYLADSQRASGAVDPEFFDATLANKLFYQVTTYLTALFQAFAAKGYTTSDSNLNTLASVCANFLTTADVEPAVVNVPYAASVTLNAGASDGFYIQSMTGNLAIAAVTGLTAGQIVAMYYQQDGTGGHTVTFPGVFVGAAQPDPAANAVSLQLFGYDANTGQLRAFTPLISDNGAWFPGLLTAGSLTLASPGTAGQVLTNVGGIFVPVSRVGPTMNTTSGHTAGINTAGTTYTAPSTAWLTVIVTGELYGGVGHSGSFAATVNGTVVNINGVTNSSGAASVTFEVPASGTYSVRTGGVAPGDDSYLNQTSWVEYTHPL